MTEKKQDKLPVSQMIGFALNGCGSSCIAGIMGGFLTIYLTDNLLLSMGFITAMMTAARIINAVTEGLSGFLIDMTHTKIGKARPWILGTAFFVALPVFLIFNTPTSFSPTGRMIWVFVNYLLHVAVFGAVISVATATLLIKITSNSVERAKVTNLGGLLGQISNLIVSAYGVPVLMYFGGYEKGYFGLSLIFCSIGFILPFLTGIICRETPEVWAEAAQQLSAARKRPSLPVKTQLKYVFGCKYALPLFGMFLTYNFAGMIFGSMAIYFLRDVLGDAGYMTQISYAKLGKRKVLVLGSLFQVVGYALMIVPNLVFVLIGNAVYGIGSAFFGVLLGTATADVADYINLKNKTDLSGLSTSIAQFGMRFGMLLGSVGVAAVLAIGGYSGEAANAGLAQSSFTRVMETVGYAVIPLVCSILLVLFSSRMDADKEVANMRKEGAE